MVSQDKDGGELGNPNFDIAGKRRTRQHAENVRRALVNLPRNSSKATQLSRQTGVLVPEHDLPLPLFGVVSLEGPHVHVPVKRMHADALVSKEQHVYSECLRAFRELLVGM